MQIIAKSPTRFDIRIYKLAEQYRLGMPLTGHKSKIFYMHLIVGFILLPITVILLINSLHTYFIDDPALITQTTKIVNACQSCPTYLRADNSMMFYYKLEEDKGVIFIMMLYVALSCLELFMAFWLGKASLYVCEEGLLYLHGKKDKWTRMIRWDEVEEVCWRGRNISQLCGIDGQKFGMISSMTRNNKINEIVKQKVMPRLLSRATEQYEKNGIVRLGSLCVQRTGLIHSSRFLPQVEDRSVIAWADIEDVCCVKDEFRIKIGSKWKCWGGGPGGAYNVANPTICVALVKHILATKDEISV